ncbi:MAG: hypothetical protein IJK87_12705 [Prevotella sp.]|nr:hypothetical protein [Prevotella sp.]
MKTKKFKIGNANGNNVKGGRNNTRTILTAAGIVAFGAANSGAGYYVGSHHGHQDKPKDENDDPQTEDKLEEKPESQENQQIDETDTQQTVQETQSQGVENITEPQPTDSTVQTHQADNTQTQHPTDTPESKVDNPNEVDPNLIAQQIIEEQTVDPNDLDIPTIISVDEIGTLYRADGSETLVAAIHTPDGAQFLLSDDDGDGFFTNVYDMEGNYVGEAEGNLMASDLEAMVEKTGGYLVRHEDEPQGDDPTKDIIDTHKPTYEEIKEDSVLIPTPPLLTRKFQMRNCLPSCWKMKVGRMNGL